MMPLTHTFISYPLSAENYAYNADLLNNANELLKGYVYDDYDKLIQLCDWLNKGGRYYTLEKRAREIIRCYKINKIKILRNYQGALALKKYFEYKINSKDIYQFWGIKE